MFIGALIGIGLEVVSPEYYIDVISAIVVAAFFMASGNILNDYFDREIDKTNHPERPIPMGQVSPENAFYSSIAIFICVITIAFFINLISFIITIVAIGLMIGYETSLKNQGFIGNLTISTLVALLFIFGGAAVNETTTVLILALLAFFATLSREVIKDIEDLEGDVTRDTIPKTIGIKNAGIIAAISLVIAVFLSPLPIIPEIIPFLNIKQFDIYYFYVVLIADIIFGTTILYIFKNPHLAQNTLKLGMVVALAAFIVGGIL
ncbi:MAG: UbiA family prenyltransferase [Thermoplasmata archaeon]|nr:UbiA family prenyltransferase [Thermoplasmata archaeon]